MISKKKIDQLQEIISYSFKNKKLLESALIHPSYISENKKKLLTDSSDFERLEFLGDRVLGLAISSIIYKDIEWPFILSSCKKWLKKNQLLFFFTISLY